MNKEKILFKNREDNLFFDEREKQIKFKGRSFGMNFTLLLCLIVYVIKLLNNENCYDIMTIIWAVVTGTIGYEAFHSKDKAKIILTIFLVLFMLYNFIKFIITMGS